MENGFDLDMAEAGLDDGSYYVFDNIKHGSIRFQSKQDCMEFLFLFIIKNKEEM